MSPSDLQVLLFRVGRHSHVVDQALIRAFSVAGKRSDRPLVSLSRLLGLSRDSAVDERVLEVQHEGRTLGLQVTAVDGLWQIERDTLKPLPALIRRNCASRAVLGIVAGLQGNRAGPGQDVIALDLTELLDEQADKLPSRSEEAEET